MNQDEIDEYYNYLTEKHYRQARVSTRLLIIISAIYLAIETVKLFINRII